MKAVRPSLLSIVLLLLAALASPIAAQDDHDGGLWGTAKDTIETVARPIRDAACSKYEGLSDKGRFLTGACVGFGASRFAVRTTMKSVKTFGACYIAFEALEYAGLLKEARYSTENRQLLAASRDYLLRTADGLRHDIRTQLNPQKISSRVRSGMEKDKAGTVGFGTGAFLGFAL